MSSDYNRPHEALEATFLNRDRELGPGPEASDAPEREKFAVALV
jgi:hypothetical protein